MSSRSLVIIIVVVVLGFTALSLRNYMTHEPEAAPEVAVQRYLVAKHALSSGSFIQVAQDLEFRPVPSGQPEAGMGNYVYEGAARPTDFSGAVVRRAVAEGEPITPDALMKSGEGGFLSAVLQPGMRAVSISVNITTGNAGFISPGDHVDLLITHRVKGSGNNDIGTGDQVVTETFIRKVRVLAVDQMLDNPENKPILAKTVTIEVTPKQAESISVATEMGKISMALISNGAPAKVAGGKEENTAADTTKTPLATEAGEADAADVDNKRYTVDGDVSALVNAKESGVSKVRVVRAGVVETLEFYQGRQ